jgi:anthranilate phosphoribosyltransferase
VITGKGTIAQNSVVLANSATALATYFPGRGIEECIEMAESSLTGGKALQVLNQLISLQ